MASLSCQAGRRFRRCRRPTSHTCQYCGRAFCPEHGAALADGQEVCLRPICRAKLDDVETHQHFRDRVRQRNFSGACGLDGCAERPLYQCSLCKGVFCPGHISDRLWTTRTRRMVDRRPVAACPHCWDRRKIWSKP
jgi:hypothetical protein